MKAPDAARRGVSIVVPCYNRGAYLDLWFASLSWWTPGPTPVEICVVDDGGGDATEDVVRAWRRRGLDTNYLRIRPPSPPRNNARARNAGIKAARYPLVLNTDPDIVFVTDVVGRLLAGSGRETYCTPTEYLPLTESASRELWALARTRSLTAADVIRDAAGRPNLVHRPDGVAGLHGAFLCERETLVELRGYDERFSEWGWEDRDLLTRLDQRGLERRFVPGVTVVHQWHPVLRRDSAACDRDAVLLQMGWQRACAFTPGSVCRNAQGWGGAPTMRSATSEVPSSANTLQVGWTYAAEVYLREGRTADARRILAAALAARLPSGAPRGSLAAALDTLRRADDAATGAFALMLAHTAHAEGDSATRDAAIDMAVACGDTCSHAIDLRARALAASGSPDAAVALIQSRLAESVTVPLVARLVELHVNDCRYPAARQVLEQSTRALEHVDTYAQLLLACYQHVLVDMDGRDRSWFPHLGDESPSDFLFSVAMRARRDGLDRGAAAALRAFLAVPHGTDDALRARAEQELVAIEASSRAAFTPRRA